MDSAIDTFLLDEIEVGSFPLAVYAVGSSQRIEAENAPAVRGYRCGFAPAVDTIRLRVDH